MKGNGERNTGVITEQVLHLEVKSRGKLLEHRIEYSKGWPFENGDAQSILTPTPFCC